MTVSKQQRACRVIDAAGGRLSPGIFRARMGDDWTPGLRGNLTTGGQIEPSSGARDADLVLTDFGRAYAKGEGVTRPRRRPVVDVKVTGGKAPPPAVDVDALARLAQPLIERRDALQGELARINAAIAALGAG